MKKSRSYIELKVSDDKMASFILESTLKLTDYEIIEQGTLRIYERLNESPIFNRVLSENGLDISAMSIINDTLEDYFL